MAIFFTDETARDFWFWTAATGRIPQPNSKVRSVNLSLSLPPAAEILDAAIPFARPNQKTTVLIADKRANRHSNTIKTRVCSKQLPSFSFYRIAPDIYVASPELLFIRTALKEGLFKATQLGCFLTATFVPDENNMIGFSKCDAITTVANIKRYIDRCAKIHLNGHNDAARALSLVVEGAASPREVDLAILLTMPRRSGGYGLPKPELNAKLTLKENNRTFERYPDFLWRKQKIIIEYDSDEFHASKEKLHSDSLRRGLLQRAGFTVITVTNAEFKSMQLMDAIAASIAKKLKLAQKREPSKYFERKCELRRMLCETAQ